MFQSGETVSFFLNRAILSLCTLVHKSAEKKEGMIMSQSTPSSTSAILYTRSGSYIPRVAAVHDMCGYGKCSLGVAIPVLSAAGIDVCPVPTALFSAHTKFPVFYMHDTTEILNDYLDAWKQEGIDLDGVYSGFLGSADQVAVIQRLYKEYPGALRIVDPVMGDGGVKYPTYTDELCEAMAGLVDGADVLTPNLTEASILTGIPYQGQDVDEAFIQKNVDTLLEMGAKSVVIKGVVHEGEGIIRNYLASAQDGGKIERCKASCFRICCMAPETCSRAPYAPPSTPAAASTTPSTSQASLFATQCASPASSLTLRCAASPSSPRWAKWQACSHRASCASITAKGPHQRALLVTYDFPLG